MTINFQFIKYKEAIRHLWNTYFYNDGNATWDDFEVFQEIDKLLFDKMILGSIDAINQLPNDEALKLLRVKSTSNGFKIMINRTGDGGNWDHPIDALVHDDYEIQFLEYFDWDQLGIKDCRYVMCKIIYSKLHPEIIGHKAIIESWHLVIDVKTV